MKVLVTGATGSQAKPVVFELLKHGHEVVAMTRDASKASDLREAGAEIFEGDLLDGAAVKEAVRKVDAIALHVPFFMADPQAAAEQIVTAAVETKIEYIVWNTAGIIAPEKTGNPAYDVRLSLKQLLAESGIAHTILQPTVYAENLLGPWTAPLVQSSNRVAYPVPEAFKMGWLPSSDMAKVMRAALEDPSLAGSEWIISGKQILDGRGLSAAFSQGLGREIQYYAMPPVEFGQILDRIMGKGAGAAV
ncbi:MAG: NmrA family NAD(P)-binding protein, partial [Bacteroidota bacterium]